jgi:hypothetical protein
MVFSVVPAIFAWFWRFLESKYLRIQQVKSLVNETHEEIIKRYDYVFRKLTGKGQDTMSLGRVLDFGNYCKKIVPIIAVNSSSLRISRRWLHNLCLPKIQVISSGVFYLIMCFQSIKKIVFQFIAIK